MSTPSPTDALITRAERRAQALRPAELTYGTTTIPCTPGNLDFFEQLRNGGFVPLRGMPIRILREDVPDEVVFRKGENVEVRDKTTGDTYALQIGDNNSQQTVVIILNLETPAG